MSGNFQEKGEFFIFHSKTEKTPYDFVKQVFNFYNYLGSFLYYSEIKIIKS